MLARLGSLRWRLALASALLAVVVAALTALVVASTTSADLIGDVDDRLGAQTVIVSDLSAYASVNASWIRAQPLVRELEERFGVRIALTTLDGQPLVDSQPGNEPLPSVAAAVIDPNNPLLEATPSEGFNNETAELVEALQACLADRGLVVDVQFAEHGGFTTVPALEGGDAVVLEECRGQVVEASGTSFFPAESGSEGPRSDLDNDAESPLPVLEPALLFLGEGPQPSVDRQAVLFAVLAIIGVAALAAAILSGRLVRPMRRLTGAAERVRGGDLSARVDIDDSSELGRADEHRRRFTSDVAHELRTPLTILTSQVDAMLSGIEPPTKATLQTTQNEVNRLARLVGDLQQLSLADENELRLDPIELVLDDVSEAAIDAFQSHASQAGVELASEGGAPEPVSVDVIRMRQTIDNIVANAIRHTPQGGRVTVRTTQDEEHTAIDVSDTGDGIPDDFLPHIFDRFSRADESRARATGGSGLGLAVTREIVRAHGGELTAENIASGGSRFTIRLQRA